MILLYFFVSVWKLPASILRNSHSQISPFIKNLLSLKCCLFLFRPLPLTPLLQSCHQLLPCPLVCWSELCASVMMLYLPYDVPAIYVFQCGSGVWLADLLAYHTSICLMERCQSTRSDAGWAALSWKTLSRSALPVLGCARAPAHGTMLELARSETLKIRITWLSGSRQQLLHTADPLLLALQGVM